MITRPEDIPLDALWAAAARPEVLTAMQSLYEDVDARIAELPGVCWNRGECCRFGQYGHRLYVTALEIVYYLALHRAGASRRALTSAARPRAASPRALPILPAIRGSNDACPHASGGQCHARQGRPAGCRIFYCDPQAQHWQGPLTEEVLHRLRILHDELDVPYFYIDWMIVQHAIAGGVAAAADGSRSG